ncbi:MAG: insulinase family protein [Halomonas sp.]|nr:insulinase family protein [Halomonas sp.]
MSLTPTARCCMAAAAALLITGPAAAEHHPEADAITEVVSPLVSPHDSRDYRVLTLENGLTALLVSDPDADKAAASMNVSVGSAQDPEDLDGLAHFLEHMLFLGTEPFPEADAYQGYISRRGGSHNAFTAPQDTNYFFDIDPDALEGALDRFSQFFISPLFNADRLESERNIVHSEYMARIRDDGRRENDVLNTLLNPENPTNGFSVGSRETLADRPEGEPSLRERVIDFYQRYYDANVMHLTLVAPQPLDELETLVAERFAVIADRGLEAPSITAPLALEEAQPQRVALQSVRDSRHLRLLFPIPDPIAEYRHKPAELVAHLLGHEGEGSLLAVLREAGWADGLSAGISRGDGHHALFSVNISLTPDGAKARDAIEATLFEVYLNALTPDNLIRLYSAPDVEGDMTSPWFHAPWGEDKRQNNSSEANALTGLALPAPNPFIAEDLALRDVQDERPQHLVEAPAFDLWHMADATFNTPKVEWRFSLQHPEAASSARDAALARLLAGWLDDSLNEAFYPARLAGQHFEAYAHARGITLSFSGWRDRQERMVERVLNQLQVGDISEASVERVRYRLQREWRNAPQAALHRQAGRTLAEALVRPQWPSAALLEASQELNADDLRDYRDALMAELRLEAMAVGNLTADEAEALGRRVAEALAPTLNASAIPDLMPLRADADLPSLTPHTSREESVVLRYLQGPDRSLASQARVAVLGQLIDTPFYQRLRTEEQLGYVVNAGYSPMLDAPGLALLVQSPETESAAIDARIDAFLDDFETTLAALDDETLAPYRQAVHDSLIQRDTSLAGRAGRLWQAMSFGDTEFDRRERLAEQALAVDADALRKLWPTLRETAVARVAYDPGNEPDDVLALTQHLEPLPEVEE